MARQDLIIKWTLYALGLLPLWFLELFVLGRFPLFGVTPMLLPLAAVVVGVLEGPLAGAGYGLAVGILCDAVYFSTNGAMTLALTLIGWATGAACTYVLDRNLLGSILCAAVGLFAIDAGRVFVRMFTGAAPLPVLLGVALPELLWSLAFTLLIYPWFLLIRRRIEKLLRL